MPNTIHDRRGTVNILPTGQTGLGRSARSRQTLIVFQNHRLFRPRLLGGALQTRILVVRLTVRDDGDATTTARNPSGYGLMGMTERATLVGGTLTAGPSSNRGWTVSAVLPKGGAGQ